jgi:hypothetical protein
MRLDSEKLHVIESAPSSSEDCRRVARALRAAMNDWPTMNLTSVDDFVQELEKNFAPLTYESIKVCASRLNSANDAWMAEGLSELLEAWVISDRHKTLNELVSDLQQATANQ